MRAFQVTTFDQPAMVIDCPEPVAKAGEVLLKVLAAGVNNTDINTRIGWYSKQVTGDTNSGADTGYDELDAATATWSGSALQLPHSRCRRLWRSDCRGCRR